MAPWPPSSPRARTFWVARASEVGGDSASPNSPHVSHRVRYSLQGWGEDPEKLVFWAPCPPGFFSQTLGPPLPLPRLNSFMTFSDLNGNFLTKGTQFALPSFARLSGGAPRQQLVN